MKIARTVVGACGSGPTCPEVHVLEDGRWLIRGYKLADAGMRDHLDMPHNEDAVLLPADIVRQIKEDPAP